MRLAPFPRIVLVLSTFWLALNGCRPAAGAIVSPTPVLADLTASSPQVQPEAPRPTLEPYRFYLPTPGAAPVSGWRPPLYPVPWALSAYDHFYFIRPIAADQVNWPVADYRYGGIFFAPNVVHTGVDIPAPEGTPIHAAGSGTVIWAGWGLFTGSPQNDKDPYGLAVAIRHDFGYQNQQLFTIYAHMSAVRAVVGQHVETGDEIGLVGATGETTGPHLHFEVRFPLNSFYNTYNPELWMVPPEGRGVLAGRIMETDGKPLHQIEVTVRSEQSGKFYTVKTYGERVVNADPHYNENMVLGDLPAGIYKITLRYEEKEQQFWVEIFPGQVTYFTFRGERGFKAGPPPTPYLNFLPATATASP